VKNAQHKESTMPVTLTVSRTEAAVPLLTSMTLGEA